MKKFLLILLLVVFLTGCSTEKQESENYVLFVLNVHDWVFPEKSIDVVERTIEIHEKYKVPVEIYIDDPAFQNFVENAPDLIEKLKSSEYVTVSYHFRPPMPAYSGFDFIGLSEMNPDELYETLKSYEEHRLDLETGLFLDEPGGYQFIKDTIGYSPVTAGSTAAGNTGTILEKIYFEKGAKFSVVNSGDAVLGDKKEYLFVRPQQVEIKLYEENLGFMHGDVTFESIINDVIEEYTGDEENIFINIKMHENNYYVQYTPWWPTYYVSNDKDVPLEPPFDLEASASNVKLRSSDYTDSMWELYERTIVYVAENPDKFNIVSPLDVLEMVE